VINILIITAAREVFSMSKNFLERMLGKELPFDISNMSVELEIKKFISTMLD
jgi:hypothetical protein